MTDIFARAETLVGKPNPTDNMNQPIEVDWIHNCERCGDMHAGIMTFQPLHRMTARHTHWAMCPSTQEPIMMNFRSDQRLFK